MITSQNFTTYTPEYPSPALLFQLLTRTVRKYNSEKHHSQEQRTLKVFLQISSCSQILLASSCPTQGCHHTPTGPSGLIWPSYSICECNTGKSSGGNHTCTCCCLIFSLRKSLCSLLEWPQDINIK